MDAGWRTEKAGEAGTKTGGAGSRALRPTTEGRWVEGTWAAYRDGFGSCVAYYRGRVTRVLSTRAGSARVLLTTGAGEGSGDVPSGGEVRAVSLSGCLASTVESSSSGGHSSSPVMSDGGSLVDENSFVLRGTN